MNKKPIKKHVLRHGDIIEIGKYQLTYENKTQENKPAVSNGFENKVVSRPAKLVVDNTEAKLENEKPVVEPASANANMPTPEPKVGLSDSTQKIGYLRVLNGENSGSELSLNKSMTTLGKPGVQLAMITKRPHGYFISHVEGDKQLLVNGQNAGIKAHELNDRDVIDLIDTQMEFYLA